MTDDEFKQYYAMAVHPRQDLLELAAATEVNDEQARVLRDGMELLVG